MPLYDQERLLRLIMEMRKSVSRLRSLSEMDIDGFIRDPDKVASAKYNFIVAIEACIDICSHIISRNGYRAPEDYGDTFAVMEEVGAIDPGFSSELIKMAKFRNRLVHIYWQVNDDQLHEILRTRLDDFKSFLSAIAVFLDLRDLNAL
ncbi:MAG TPA: DUF86 domain-containing protein [Desulfobacteraceae bacterium]|nr:DUF86 domain-containing protein [Desulfobacteraceae bacterium]